MSGQVTEIGMEMLKNIERSIRKIRNILFYKHLKKSKSLKYDYIFSLGEVCFCSTILRKLKLRRFAAPFDWIAGSDFKSRIDILYNEFENFLNFEDLVYHAQREEPEPCDIYVNKRTNLTFNRDFPINSSLEKTYGAAKSKYERRIARLLKVLAQRGKDILIIYMELPQSENNPKCDLEIVEAVDKLNNKFKANINLLYIAHSEDFEDEEYHRKSLSSNITKITLFNRDKSAEDPWTGNLKNSELVLQNIFLK